MSATAAPPLPPLCVGGCGFDGERQRTDPVTGTAQWLCSFCDGDRVDTTTNTNATTDSTATTTAASATAPSTIADDNAVARGEDEAIAAVSAVKEKQYRAWLSRTTGCNPEAVVYDADDAAFLLDAAAHRADTDVTLSVTGNWALVCVRTGVTRTTAGADHTTTVRTGVVVRVNPTPVCVVDRSTYRLEHFRSADTTDWTRGVTVRWRTPDDGVHAAAAAAAHITTTTTTTTSTGGGAHAATSAQSNDKDDDGHARPSSSSSSAAAAAAAAAAAPALAASASRGDGAAAGASGAISVISAMRGSSDSGLVSKGSGARSYASRDAHAHASVLEITDHDTLHLSNPLTNRPFAAPLVRWSAAWVVDPQTAARWTTALRLALPSSVPAELRALILQTAFDM